MAKAGETLDVTRADDVGESDDLYFGSDLFTGDELRVRAQATGGLTAAEFEVEPGITALVGQNATNRSSVLRGIAATLGADLPPAGLLRTDAERGFVTLDAPASESAPPPSLHLDLERHGPGSVGLSRAGTIDPSWSTAAVTNFVALFEDNPIRTAIARGDTSSLYDHLMAPVDVDTLEREIEEVKRERSRIEDRIASLEDRKSQLPDLEAQLRETADAIEETRADLEAARERVEELNTDAEEAEEAEALVDDLETKKSQLEETREDLELQRREIGDLEATREDLEEQLEALEVPTESIDDIETRISELRGERRSLNETVTELRRIVEFNRELLDGDFDLVGGAGDDVLAELNPEEKEIECWTCGSTVQREAVHDRTDELRGFLEEQEAQLGEIESRIEDLREDKRTLESAAEERERYRKRLREVERDLNRRRSRVPTLEEQIEAQEREVAQLEAEVEETQQARESEILDAYQEVSSHEVELDRLESERETLEGRIADIEEEIERMPELEETREDLSAELDALRNRVAERERAIVEAFNEQMDAILSQLGYANLSRVWIERTVERGQTARDRRSETSFELHIVREAGDDGTVYEDPLVTLSESEREVIGIVIAIAGYLAHDIEETVPVLLLDSLEAIDADRLRELITYIARETDVEYLIAALLPEDAERMPEHVAKRHAEEFVESS